MTNPSDLSGNPEPPNPSLYLCLPELWRVFQALGEVQVVFHFYVKALSTFNP